MLATVWQETASPHAQLAAWRRGVFGGRGPWARIASRLALAAAISLNYELGRPSRALGDYVA